MGWFLRDTAGIAMVLAITFAAARAVEGIAQGLIASADVVVALLWIGNFVLRGDTDAMRTPETNS